MDDIVATGRRKTAVSSVRLRPGSGKIDVNGKNFEEYFPLELQRQSVLSPFDKGKRSMNSLDLTVRVKGGGIEGQVIATRLGIARALLQENTNLHDAFREEGYLTRDSRKKERKKYGRKKARKRFQFSKR